MKNYLRITCCVMLLGTCRVWGQDATVSEDDTRSVIVMFGDSTTDRGMAKQVKKQLDRLVLDPARSPKVINAGKGYDNATSALDRLAKDVLAHDPDIVTVSFGLNDVGGRKPEQYQESLQKIIKTLRESDIQVVLLTSTPFDNSRHGWAKDFQALGGLDEYLDKNFCARMRSLADGKDVVLCDLHTIFKKGFEEDPKLLETVICGDGVHLTAEGNILAAKHVAPVIYELLPAEEVKTDTGAALTAAVGKRISGEPIPISEPGFEADGAWKFGLTGNSVDGFFGVVHASYIDAGIIDPVPDRGDLCTYNNGPQHDLYQVLETNLAANTTYELSIVAIHPTFAKPFPGGELRLGYVPGEDDATTGDSVANDFYGEYLVKPVQVRKPIPVNGLQTDDGYETWIWTFTTGAASAGQGKPLRIEILGGGKPQSLFDNVRLDAAAGTQVIAK